MGATYYGNLIRRRIAGEFVITESAFVAGAALPVHSHPDPYFTFTLRGSYSERCGKQVRVCTPGTAVAHPAFEAHSQEFAGDPVLLIRVAPAAREADVAVKAALEAPLCVKNASIARALSQMHGELGTFDASSDLILEGLAFELTGHALATDAARGGSRKRALCAQTFLRSSLREPPPLGVVSKELGVSRATLYRDFKSAFGCAPGDYVRRVRLARAATLLRETKRALCEIAAECGFYDQSHFDRAFRRAYGVSPSQYRDRAR